MPLTIDDPEIERLAEDLARRTGESLREAVAAAVRERLERTAPAVGGDAQALFERLMAISELSARLPDLDRRTADEIVGYDETGAFKPW